MSDVSVDHLRDADVPAAFALSARVGWNQSEADWRRLIALEPEGAVAVRVAGELVATATLATYGRDLHWIGMVITDPKHRGRGFGTRMLERAIERSHALGGRVLGLDATELGEPLYRRHGFVAVHSVDRWAGALRPFETAASLPPSAAPDEAQWAALLELDRRACGVDRSGLLEALRAEGARTWVVPDGDGVRGFAFLRPGRERAHLGPLVAARQDDAAALLAAAAAERAGGEVLLDAPRTPASSELLRGGGLEVQRNLVRMTQGGSHPALLGDAVRAATSLEWG